MLVCNQVYQVRLVVVVVVLFTLTDRASTIPFNIRTIVVTVKPLVNAPGEMLK